MTTVYGKPVRMQRRHFYLIADVLFREAPLDRFSPAYAMWKRIVLSMADKLATTNDGFKRERFLSAAGLDK